MFSKYFIELDQSYGNVLCKTVLLLELSKQSNVVKKCCEVAKLGGEEKDGIEEEGVFIADNGLEPGVFQEVLADLFFYSNLLIF